MKRNVSLDVEVSVDINVSYLLMRYRTFALSSKDKVASGRRDKTLLRQKGVGSLKKKK